MKIKKIEFEINDYSDLSEPELQQKMMELPIKAALANDNIEEFVKVTIELYDIVNIINSKVSEVK